MFTTGAAVTTLEQKATELQTLITAVLSKLPVKGTHISRTHRPATPPPPHTHTQTVHCRTSRIHTPQTYKHALTQPIYNGVKSVQIDDKLITFIKPSNEGTPPYRAEPVGPPQHSN